VNVGSAWWRGRLALLATVVVWSTPPIFQFWLARSFDPWTQNFYRYAAGFLVMSPFLWWMTRRDVAVWRRVAWRGCGWAAVPNVVHQVAQTMAVVLLMPGVYALLGRISVVFTAVLAVVMFADERWIARSTRFTLGISCGLLGLAGLAWSEGGFGTEVKTTAGFGLGLLAAGGWALYGILVKKHTAESGPTLGFGVISFFTTALLMPFMVVFGDPAAVLRADLWTNTVLLGSGILSIGLGHWLYYIGIRELGAAPSQAALLLCPLGTMLLSAGLFGETFHPGQLVSGVVLLCGALFALTAKPPVVEEPA
jgi:drug/metabolite transporter (DMT)-like permease